MICSQLTNRARDSAKKVLKSVLMSDNGAKAVVAAIQCHVPLSFFSAVYAYFSSVVGARRADNESYRQFES